jgi:hypothetical protein
MLDRAESVLIALRRCTTDAAFAEIASASKRHRLPTLSIAAARYEWGSLLEQVRR